MHTIDELKQRKKALGITYDALATRSNVPLRTLENIFNGITKHPRIDTMQAIERALGLENEKTPSDDLSDGEKALLDLFRQVPVEQREMVLQMIKVALRNV